MRSFKTLLLLGALGLFGGVTAQLADAQALPSPSASPSKSPRLASFKERLAAAQTVQVKTDILGVELDSSLEEAHKKLDSLAEASKPAVEAEEGEHNENEHKMLWQLAKSDFKSVLVKTDEEERIIYIAGFLRPGKEIPFNQLGEIEKAPILSDRNVAWDTVRPGQPLIRVTAQGENRKATSIIIFVVKRPLAR